MNEMDQVATRRQRCRICFILTPCDKLHPHPRTDTLLTTASNSSVNADHLRICSRCLSNYPSNVHGVDDAAYCIVCGSGDGWDVNNESGVPDLIQCDEDGCQSTFCLTCVTANWGKNAADEIHQCNLGATKATIGDPVHAIPQSATKTYTCLPCQHRQWKESSPRPSRPPPSLSPHLYLADVCSEYGAPNGYRFINPFSLATLIPGQTYHTPLHPLARQYGMHLKHGMDDAMCQPTSVTESVMDQTRSLAYPPHCLTEVNDITHMRKDERDEADNPIQVDIDDMMESMDKEHPVGPVDWAAAAATQGFASSSPSPVPSVTPASPFSWPPSASPPPYPARSPSPALPSPPPATASHSDLSRCPPLSPPPSSASAHLVRIVSTVLYRRFTGVGNHGRYNRWLKYLHGVTRVVSTFQSIFPEHERWKLRIYWDASLTVPCPCEVCVEKRIKSKQRGTKHVEKYDLAGAWQQLRSFLETLPFVQLRFFNFPAYQCRDLIEHEGQVICSNSSFHRGDLGMMARFLALAELGITAELVLLSDLDGLWTKEFKCKIDEMMRKKAHCLRCCDPEYTVPLWGGSAAFAYHPDTSSPLRFPTIEASFHSFCTWHMRDPHVLSIFPSITMHFPHDQRQRVREGKIDAMRAELSAMDIDVEGWDDERIEEEYYSRQDADTQRAWREEKEKSLSRAVDTTYHSIGPTQESELYFPYATDQVFLEYFVWPAVLTTCETRKNQCRQQMQTQQAQRQKRATPRNNREISDDDDEWELSTGGLMSRPVALPSQNKVGMDEHPVIARAMAAAGGARRTDVVPFSRYHDIHQVGPLKDETRMGEFIRRWIRQYQRTKEQQQQEQQQQQTRHPKRKRTRPPASRQNSRNRRSLTSSVADYSESEASPVSAADSNSNSNSDGDSEDVDEDECDELVHQQVRRPKRRRRSERIQRINQTQRRSSRRIKKPSMNDNEADQRKQDGRGVSEEGGGAIVDATVDDGDSECASPHDFLSIPTVRPPPSKYRCDMCEEKCAIKPPHAQHSPRIHAMDRSQSMQVWGIVDDERQSEKHAYDVEMNDEEEIGDDDDDDEEVEWMMEASNDGERRTPEIISLVSPSPTPTHTHTDAVKMEIDMGEDKSADTISGASESSSMTTHSSDHVESQQKSPVKPAPTSTSRRSSCISPHPSRTRMAVDTATDTPLTVSTDFDISLREFIAIDMDDENQMLDGAPKCTSAPSSSTAPMTSSDDVTLSAIAMLQYDPLFAPIYEYLSEHDTKRIWLRPRRGARVHGQCKLLSCDANTLQQLFRMINRMQQTFPTNKISHYARLLHERLRCKHDSVSINNKEVTIDASSTTDIQVNLDVGSLF